MASLLFTDPFQIVNDCKLVSKAARLGWPIPVEDKIAILKRLQSIVENSEEEREAIAAAKAIMMADGINAKREAARQAKRMAKTSGVNVTVNTAVQVNGSIDVEQFRRLPAGERIRLLREAIDTPPRIEPPRPPST